MRWTRGERSENLEDQRGAGGGGFSMGGTGIKLGLGGTVVVGLLSVLFGQDLFSTLGISPTDDQTASGRRAPQSNAAEEELVDFVSFVLDDVQSSWQRQLPQRYVPAKLVLFTDGVRSGCGVGEAAMGPFYCPVDRKAYIDLGFYKELRARFGAPGDFAQAYVLAHEIGHHVQNLLGISDRTRAGQRQRPDSASALSVRLELQADCFAGIWAHSTKERHLLEAGDIEEALGAAAAIGDDRLQKQATGTVHPETWTHGSSAQRVQWLKKGLEGGRVEDCDTFSANR